MGGAEALADPKISKRSRRQLQMLEEQVAVGMWAAYCVHLGLSLLPAERRLDAVFTVFEIGVPTKSQTQRLIYYDTSSCTRIQRTASCWDFYLIIIKVDLKSEN